MAAVTFETMVPVPMPGVTDRNGVLVFALDTSGRVWCFDPYGNDGKGAWKKLPDPVQ